MCSVCREAGRGRGLREKKVSAVFFFFFFYIWRGRILLGPFSLWGQGNGQELVWVFFFFSVFLTFFIA